VNRNFLSPLEFSKTSSSQLGSKQLKELASTMAEEGWKTSMAPQEVITMKNLFQDYKSGENSKSGLDSHHINYEKLKSDRATEMTKKAINPRVSLQGDPATGIVGFVPNFQTMKFTHRQGVHPFFASVKQPYALTENPDKTQAPPSQTNWAKVTDPK
jgi:hypothetical protein